MTPLEKAVDALQEKFMISSRADIQDCLIEATKSEITASLKPFFEEAYEDGRTRQWLEEKIKNQT